MKIVMKLGLTIALCFYLLILSKLILFKYLTIPDIIGHFTFSYEGAYWNSHNFIPFKTITYYLFLANDINFNIRVENLTGNIIGFVPFGLILLLSSKFHSFKKVTIATFCLKMTFELLQLIFRFGSFDVLTYLILNTIGGMIGYIPIKLASMYLKQRRGEQKSVMD